MKTKSKRFLNLATLCLALLGTTLLMARPVKAEFTKVTESVTKVTEGEEQSGGDSSEQLGNSNLEDDPQEYGNRLGIDAGRKASSFDPTISYEEIPDPERDDWKSNDQKLTEYKEGYMAGYSEGWYETHKLESAILGILEWIWQSIFG
ncbi:TPA: hypothetical protein VJW12_000086 [Streptococcus pyogenes]|uniref:hypothetical protein n=1 Tax=Streptococcus pyogenes TaxID=1314 RepID=UPI000DA31094|nr:hypothetical protein [Streptococcus pyogenes]SQE97104.1 hypothetical membrane associated protein [Streptococcus pyogenes]VGT07163.1 hypothetical membrane associated protein [Streptococcus pyogenes]VGT31754.1 hypothetical membrane associated protein [Streptococcus pyogenes]VHD89855.1 Uncharacterised protein [Streptococcus pyogenes]VHF98994.1 Uncharacterised protein [Streptococcus pyogenes]